MGLPGVLPVANQAVFEKAVQFGLGVGAEINRVSRFDRKNTSTQIYLRAIKSLKWMRPSC